jgi:hypothetical protein
VDVIPSDPRRDLTLTWNRQGVEVFRDLLLSQRMAPEGALTEMGRVAHLLKAWLDRADPYEDEGDRWPGLSG